MPENEQVNTTIIQPPEGFIVNNGLISLELEFDTFDTHTDLCYEYSDCELLEPVDSNTTVVDEDELGNVLICYEEN